jgi:hypothetical protein
MLVKVPSCGVVLLYDDFVSFIHYTFKMRKLKPMNLIYKVKIIIYTISEHLNYLL